MWKSHPGPGTLPQNLATEAVKLGLAAARRSMAPRSLDQATPLDQTAEVLLVEPDPSQRFHQLLQRQQGEGFGEQFKNDGPVGELAAQTGEGGCRNAPVIEHHRFAR